MKKRLLRRQRFPHPLGGGWRVDVLVVAGTASFRSIPTAAIYAATIRAIAAV